MVSLQKTIYLDIDEELTSIVKRFKKSAAEEITLVVPRKAVLLQSIVNLKILKKEADRLGKKIIINTTDKIGKNLATKAGFVVHKRIENSSEIQGNNSSAENGFFSQEIKKENSEQERTPIKIRDIVMKNKDKGDPPSPSGLRRTSRSVSALLSRRRRHRRLCALSTRPMQEHVTSFRPP